MSEWISIKERTPEIEPGSNRSAVVLVYGKNGFVAPRRWWISLGESGSFGQIRGTHWMPLPAPPSV